MLHKWLDKKVYKCNKCSNGFTRKEIYNSFNGKPIICNSCKTKHYISFISRIMFSLSPTVPLFIHIFVDYNYPLLIFIIWILIALLAVPFYARYSN